MYGAGMLKLVQQIVQACIYKSVIWGIHVLLSNLYSFCFLLLLTARHCLAAFENNCPQGHKVKYFLFNCNAHRFYC